jgi:hypothetical protein
MCRFFLNFISFPIQKSSFNKILSTKCFQFLFKDVAYISWINYDNYLLLMLRDEYLILPFSKISAPCQYKCAEGVHEQLCLIKGETVSTPLDKDGIDRLIYNTHNGRGTTLHKGNTAIILSFFNSISASTSIKIVMGISASFLKTQKSSHD